MDDDEGAAAAWAIYLALRFFWRAWWLTLCAIVRARFQ